MRADRLLTLVGLLRQHGRLSAPELARRLEVTPRTVLRDVEALSGAGVPIYAERGRRGGFSLLPGYKPDAADLAPEEAQALFLADASGIADALGLAQPLDRALRKLAAGLPEAEARRLGHAASRIVIDPDGWGVAAPQPEVLAELFGAVLADHRLEIDYAARSSGRGGRRVVDPWGLILAGQTWYLLAADDGVPHTYRVSRIAGVEVLDEAARRPAGLDVVAEWRRIRAAWRTRPVVHISLLVDAPQAELVRRSLGLVLVGEPTVVSTGERFKVDADVTSLRGAVGVLLGFGSWVEVVEPPEMRALMVEVALRALATYSP